MAATYTHTGWLTEDSFGTYWHGCGKPKARHACNQEGCRSYRTLCGRLIAPDPYIDSDFASQVKPRDERPVTCKRCLATLARTHKCRYCGHEVAARGKGAELVYGGLAGTLRLYYCKDAEACGERIRATASLK